MRAFRATTKSATLPRRRHPGVPVGHRLRRAQTRRLTSTGAPRSRRGMACDRTTQQSGQGHPEEREQDRRRHPQVDQRRPQHRLLRPPDPTAHPDTAGWAAQGRVPFPDAREPPRTGERGIRGTQRRYGGASCGGSPRRVRHGPDTKTRTGHPSPGRKGWSGFSGWGEPVAGAVLSTPGLGHADLRRSPGPARRVLANVYAHSSVADRSCRSARVCSPRKGCAGDGADLPARAECWR
jgi:hypothetical protein